MPSHQPYYLVEYSGPGGCTSGVFFKDATMNTIIIPLGHEDLDPDGGAKCALLCSKCGEELVTITTRAEMKLHYNHQSPILTFTIDPCAVCLERQRRRLCD